MSAETTDATEEVRRLVENPDRALKAPKDLDGAVDIDSARTAVRYVGTDNTVPKFQVVSTRLMQFPKGSDFTDIFALDDVIGWADSQNPVQVPVSDVDGFEPTDRTDDPYQQVVADE